MKWPHTGRGLCAPVCASSVSVLGLARKVELLLVLPPRRINRPAFLKCVAGVFLCACNFDGLGRALEAV